MEKSSTNVSKNIDEKTRAFNIIVKGAGFAFLGLILGKLFSYVFHLIIARLGPEQYGLLSLGFAIVQSVVIISLLGLRGGILRYVSYNRSLGDERRVKGTITSSLKMGVTAAFFLGLIMYIFSDYISNFFTPALSPILKIFAFLIPILVASDFFLTTMVAFHQNKYSVFIRDFLEKLVKVVFTALLIYLGYGLYGAIVAYVLGVITVFVLSFYFMEKNVFPIIKTKIKSINLKKELIKFSFPLLLSGAVALIVSWTDVLMIGFFRTTSEVGIYNAALTTASLLLLFPVALNTLFLPIITGLYSKNLINELRDVYKRSSKWIFVFNLPVFLLLLAFSKQILRIMFGKEYGLGNLALTILIFGYVWHTISLTSLKTLEMKKKTKTVFIIYFIAALVNIIINYLLIPKFGAVGGAIATSASFFIGGSLLMVSNYKIMSVQPFKANYLKSLVAGLLSVYVIYLIKEAIVVNKYHMLGLGLLFVLIYGGLLLLLKVFDKEDIIVFEAIFRKLGLERIINRITNKKE